MEFAGSRAAWVKAIALQLVIIASVTAWFKIYLPTVQETKAASDLLERERKIEALVQLLIVEDRSRETKMPGVSGEQLTHPRKLRSAAPMEEVQQMLGAPDARTTDFRGGLHLTWTGRIHNLEASFDKGRLYCLRLEDRRTGHGMLVYESSWYWQSF